jgi:hypothetical protein
MSLKFHILWQLAIWAWLLDLSVYLTLPRIPQW